MHFAPHGFGGGIRRPWPRRRGGHFGGLGGLRRPQRRRRMRFGAASPRTILSAAYGFGRGGSAYGGRFGIVHAFGGGNALGVTPATALGAARRMALSSRLVRLAGLPSRLCRLGRAGVLALRLRRPVRLRVLALRRLMTTLLVLRLRRSVRRRPAALRLRRGSAAATATPTRSPRRRFGPAPQANALRAGVRRPRRSRPANCAARPNRSPAARRSTRSPRRSSRTRIRAPSSTR